ncbi:IS110 family transposase [Oceaniferula spumae]|uniref:IS110 family transposase n=1 Tax=Oceaniferula spumae TaxID=2979115 RepID=A0AAT9FHF0_9BACT
MKPIKSNIEFCIGIDISKADFHAALLRTKDKKVLAQKTFANNAAGFKNLHKWLIGKTSASLPVHICMEATGSYGEDVAFFFHDKVTRLSVVNPRAIKAHGDSFLRRCKSDPADARLIADFCLQKQPSQWIAPTPGQQKIKALSRRLTALKKSLNQESNRLKTTSDKEVVKDIKEHLRWISNHINKLEGKLVTLVKEDKTTGQQHALITSIPGFGDKTAAHLLAEIGDVSIYSNARQLAAHAGVTPSIFETGTSSKKRTPMTKAGNAHMRKMLFFPAMTAMLHNPICKAFADRLNEKGKPKIVIIGAVMNKLLHLVFGVLKNQQPFNPNLLRNP